MKMTITLKTTFTLGNILEDRPRCQSSTEIKNLHA